MTIAVTSVRRDALLRGWTPAALDARQDAHVYHVCGYGASYGDTAATDIHGGQKWVSLREDALLPLVEQFFAERVWGPMRLRKLAQQLRGYDRERKRGEHVQATKLREAIAAADRNIEPAWGYQRHRHRGRRTSF